MAVVYNKNKDDYEGSGYTPFVCIVKWAPEEEATFLARFSQSYDTPEGHGVKGVHTWNLIGKNTMVVIGWMNSHVSLQKFCTSITHGTRITMEASPATDHVGLKKALEGLKSRLPKIPFPKGSPRKSRTSKAKG